MMSFSLASNTDDNHEFIKIGRFSFCLPYFVDVKISLPSLSKQQKQQTASSSSSATPSVTVLSVMTSKYRSVLVQNTSNNNNDEQQQNLLVEEFCEILVKKERLFLLEERTQTKIKIVLDGIHQNAFEAKRRERDHDDDDDDDDDKKEKSSSAAAVHLQEPLTHEQLVAKVLLLLSAKNTSQQQQEQQQKERRVPPPPSQFRFSLIHISHYHEPPVLFFPSSTSSSSSSSLEILGRFYCSSSSLLFTAINKPQSLLVHSGGKYHKNTVEYSWKKNHPSSSSFFFPCHRLDKGTSGVLLIANDGKSAAKIGELLMSKSDEWEYRHRHEQETKHQNCIEHKPKLVSDFPNSSFEIPTMKNCNNENDKNDDIYSSLKTIMTVQKEYLARIHGKLEFPKNSSRHEQEQEDWFTVDRSIFQCLTKDDNYMRCLESEEEEQKAREYRSKMMKMNEETSTTMPKDSLHQNNKIFTFGTEPTKDNSRNENYKIAKWAVTKFKIFSYDERTNTTLVLCRPITGRTHQIRVHLAQVLGHCIVGDDAYYSRSSSASIKTKNASATTHQSSLIEKKDDDDDDDDDDDPNEVSVKKTFAVPGKHFEAFPDECPTCRNLTMNNTNNNKSLEEQFRFGSPELNLHSYRYYFVVDHNNNNDKQEKVAVAVEASLPGWAVKQ